MEGSHFRDKKNPRKFSTVWATLKLLFSALWFRVDTMFIGLFNDDLDLQIHIAIVDRMFSEFVKCAEGFGWEGGNEGNHNNPRSGWPTTGLIITYFDTRIWSRKLKHPTQPSVPRVRPIYYWYHHIPLLHSTSRPLRMPTDVSYWVCVDVVHFYVLYARHSTRGKVWSPSRVFP